MLRSPLGAPVKNALRDAIGAKNISYLLRIAATGQSYFNGAPATLGSFLDHSRIGSATYQDSSDLIQTAAQDVLRYDYTTGRRALLLEAQRTNRVAQSRNLSLIVTGFGNGSFTHVPDEPAPDGAAGGVYRLQLPATSVTYMTLGCATTETIRNLSVYAKKYDSASDFGIFDASGGGAANQMRFSAADDWGRYKISSNRLGSTQANNLGLNNTDDTYAVDVLIAFFSVNDGSELTSYIPTAGSVITRAADIATSDISVLDLSAGFTVRYEGSVLGTGRVFQLGTTGNHIALRSDGTNLIFEVYSGGALSASYTSSGIAVGDDFKFAARIETNSVNVAFNGTAATADTSAAFVEPANLYLAASDDATTDKPAVVNLVDFWIDPAKSTDAELEALTV